MPRLERSRFLPHLSVLALLLATHAYLALPRTLRGHPDGPIPLVMPARIGPYQGDNLLFCQNEQCAHFARERELTSDADGQFPCPNCEEPMDPLSIGERIALPRDTPIFRKVYTAPDRPDIQATIVFSGTERMSIHRPQICLVSQGNRIINEHNTTIEIRPGHEITLRVIEIVQEYTAASGRKIVEPAVFAYWYFSPERETPSHFVRLFWMAYDNAIRNYRPRWGYVSVAFHWTPDRPASLQGVLADFVPRFYPITEQLQAEFRAMDGLDDGP